MILKTFCIKPVLFRIFTFTLISKLIQFIFEKLEHRVSYDGEAGIGFLIVTGNHPFWVVNEGDYSFAPEGSATPVNTWVRADHLSYEGGMSLLLHDGSRVTVNLIRKILRMAIHNMGWIVDNSYGGGFNHGHVVNLKGDRPVYCRGQIADALGFVPVDGDPYGDIYYNEDFNWDDPLKRKVYNFEVEDNHTYFVGELGVWVHNTCQVDALAGQKVFYTKEDYTAYVKNNPGVENSLVLDKEGIGNATWAKLQRDTEGAVTDGATSENLYAYTLKGTNPFGEPGLDFTRFGDAILYITDPVTGLRVKSTALMDVKDGQFGASTGALYYYTNPAQYGNAAWVASQAPTTIAQLEQKLLAFVDMLQRNSAQIAQRDSQPLVICVKDPAGAELGAKAIVHALTDPRWQQRTVTNPIAGWSINDWFSDQIYITRCSSFSKIN
jgi:hypothetical protein